MVLIFVFLSLKEIMKFRQLQLEGNEWAVLTSLPFVLPVSLSSYPTSLVILPAQ